MTDLSIYTPRVAGLAPAAEPLIEQAVLDSAIEFCRRSKIWRQDTNNAVVLANTPSYVLPVPALSLCVEPLEVWVDGQDIDPAIPDNLKDEFDDWQSETGTPTRYVFNGLDAIRFVPIQTDSITVRTTLALMPTRDATSLPDILEARYFEPIIQGAAARLLQTANPNQAALHSTAFESAVADAISKSAKSHSRARIRVRPNFF